MAALPSSEEKEVSHVGGITSTDIGEITVADLGLKDDLDNEKKEMLQVWQDKLKEKGVDRVSLVATRLAKDMISCAKKQRINAVKMKASRSMIDVVLESKQSEPRGDWKKLWSAVERAKQRVDVCADLMAEGVRSFNEDMVGIQPVFAGLNCLIKPGHSSDLVLKCLDQGIAPISASVASFADQMEQSKNESTEIMDELIENTNCISGYLLLNQAIKADQKLMHDLTLQRIQLEKDLKQQNDEIDQIKLDIQKLSDQLTGKQNDIESINDVIQQLQSDDDHRQLIADHLRYARDLDLCKSMAPDPFSDGTELSESRIFKSKRIEVDPLSELEELSERRIYKPHSIAVDPSKGYELLLALAPDTTVRREEEKLVNVKMEADKIELEIKMKTEEMKVIKIGVKDRFQALVERINQLNVDSANKKAELEEMKKDAGIVGAKQMIEFSNGLSEIKIAMMNAEAGAHATQVSLSAMVKSIQTMFEAPGTPDRTMVKMPRWLEDKSMKSLMVEYFKSDDLDAKWILKDRDEWMDKKGELQELLGVNKFKLKKLGDWLLRSLYTADQKRMLLFGECFASFLVIFAKDLRNQS